MNYCTLRKSKATPKDRLVLQQKGWWAMTDLNRRHLRCERTSPPPSCKDLAKSALFIQALNPVPPARSGSRRFNEPRRTLLAATRPHGKAVQP